MRAVRPSGAPPRRSTESGYAYLMALFMVLAMVAGSVVVIGNALTQSKRQREEEAIWRGNQYVRAIRLFFHKTGHYPQNIDELRKGLPQLHFLRQAYKDPMNQTDGTWRFVYINAAGQLIGSTQYASLQQMALIDNPSLMAQQFPQIGTPAGSLGSATNNLGGFGAQLGAPQAPSGPSPATGTPDPTTGTPQNTGDQSGQPPTPPPGQTGLLGQSSFGSGGQLGNPILQQKPTGPVDGPVIGAFLTGVGGGTKSDEPSLKVLHRGKKYKDWEFIWNPLEDQAAAMQQGLAGAGQLGQPGIGGAPGGASPFGGVNPFGGGPQPAPQNPPQNQPQNPPQTNPQQ